MSLPLHDLRDLPTDELIRLHDQTAKNTAVGISYYLEELHRRDIDAAGRRMEKMTRTMLGLTWAVAVLTVVNVVAVVVDVL